MPTVARKSTHSHDGMVITFRPDRGKWVARVWLPDGLGGGTYRTKFFTSSDTAEIWAKDERAKLRTGQETSGRGLMSELVPLYLEQMRLRGVSASHFEQTQRMLARVQKVANDLRAPTFETTVLRIVTTHQAVRHGQRTPLPAADNTKRKSLGLVRSFTKWATDRGHIGRNPLAGTRLGRATRIAKITWTIDELRALVSDAARWNQCRDYRTTCDAVERNSGDRRRAASELGVHLATIYNRLKAGEPGEDPLWMPAVLGLYTGARPSEVRAMTWGMIDWEREELMLPATAPGNKTRTERRIHLMAEIIEILKPRAGIGSAPIVAKLVATMHESVYSCAFQSYCRRIGVMELGPHTLRHCCGSLMTAMGMQPIMVLLQLGHDDPKVSKRYAESAPKYSREVKEWGDQFRFRQITLAKSSSAIQSIT